jgi:hypothetical protein
MVQFSKALLKGDAKELGIIRQTFKDVLKEYVH